MKEKFTQESSKSFKERIKRQREHEHKKARDNERIAADIEKTFYGGKKQ